jgi:hypothetical protein
MVHTAEYTMAREMDQCIDDCLSCYAICVRTSQHCLELGGKHADANHIRILSDCAAICNTSAGFMLRGSPLHTRICAVCAEVCRECEHACRQCAESCERMARMTA